MSEIMTSEAIIEAEWVLETYWTKVRFPVQTKKGGWSDFDVVSYDPDKRHLVVSEAKAQGTKRKVYVTDYKNLSEEEVKDTKNLAEQYLKYHYFSFIERLEDIKNNERNVLFKDFEKSVKELTLQLVSNYAIFPDKFRAIVQESIQESIKSKFSWLKNIEVRCQIETPMEVFSRILIKERDKDQGRRYGNPILDLAREINRYLTPDYDKIEKKSVETLYKELNRPLLEALLGLDKEEIDDILDKSRKKRLSH